MINIEIESIVDHPDQIFTCVQWLNQHWEEQLSQRPTNSASEKDKQKRYAILREHNRLLPTSFLGFNNTQLVGVVSLVRYHYRGQLDKSVWLTNLYVDPVYRSCGAGTQLLNYAVEYVAKLDHKGLIKQFDKKIRLICRDQKGYYAKRGWQIHANASYEPGSDIQMYRQL